MSIALLCGLGALAAVCGADDGFVPLFNGRDLGGWVIVDVAPETFTVRDEMIVSTGVPTGTMRTERMYENFILELDWRHLKPQGNAGVFIWGDPLTAVGTPFSRGIEVQVLDGRNTEAYTSHGDIFSIWGAHMKPDRPHPNGAERCLPSEWRCNPSPEWNHYRVSCNDGVIKLEVNGKEVSGGSACRPRKGYICLESEGSECHFRNLKIKELPSTNASPEETAQADRGFRTIYTGLDLRGWKATDKHREHWQSKDWRLVYDGKCDAEDPHLWTERDYGDFELICDWRWTGKPTKRPHPMLRPDGSPGDMVEVDDAGDSGINLRGSKKNEVNIWCWPCGSGELWSYRTNPSLTPEVRAAATPKVAADRPIGQWNRFFIRMKGDHATVVLNGQVVIDNASLPGIAMKGPIGLQHHGDPIEFANLFVRELSPDEPDVLPGPLAPVAQR